jgi:DNA-binding transcriptional LysR family regulator
MALFRRVKGRLVPTAACERFAAEIDRAYQQMQDALNRASLTSSSEGRPFNVVCSPSIGRRLLPDALSAIVHNRSLAVALRIVSVAQVLPTLLAKECDAAVTLFPVLHQNVKTTPVGDAEAVLLVPRSFNLDVDGKSWMEMLADRTWITFEPRSVHGDALAAILGQAFLAPRRTHLVRFAETAVGLVEAGMGCTIVDQFSAETADPARVAMQRLPAVAPHFIVHLHSPVGGDHDESCRLLRENLVGSIGLRGK